MITLLFCVCSYLFRYCNMSAISNFVKSLISHNRVVVFSKSYCPYCKLAKDVLMNAGVSQPYVMELDLREDSNDIQKELTKMTSVSTVPYVFIDNKYVGGGSTIEELHSNGHLKKLLDTRV